MRTAQEYYIGAFSADNLFGFRMIISFSSLLILLYCIGLAALVWRAKAKGFENKFMAVLLVCEGIKATFIVSQVTPYIRRYEWLQDILWHWTIDVFFTAHITAIIMYLCIPIYYRLNRLSFMHKPSFKKHAWYIAPALGITIWLLIRTVPEFYVSDATWVVCEEGKEPTTDRWFGYDDEWEQGIEDVFKETGDCTASYETTVTTQPPGLWAIALGSPLVSLLALFFIRSSIRSYQEGDNPDFSKSLTSRSLYIGFLGKVILLLIWLGLLVLISVVNGGQVTFVDETLWRYGDPNFTERLLFFAWIFSLTLTPAAIAFEAMMFVHATLKDTVFGIDNNLRKTFTTAVFTGLGVISFIVGSELMESVIGYGVAGGVFVGLSLLVVRKPILVILDKASNRFIPSTHTPEELAYLDAYATAMEDLIITAEERKILDTVASTFGLNERIVKQLEDEYNSALEEE
tara:strand:- start:2175 stop:3551 length:1377 start_codon:yes stop_codon:yes gene_type:complete